MSQLKLFLFGPPRLERKGQAVEMRRRKVWALVAYLAATNQRHSRDTLATLFWPDHDQSGARANLRRELSRLNRFLGAGQLLVDREHVSLNPEAKLWLDVDQFQHRLAQGQTQPVPDCLPLLTEATTLYTNDFLAGFTLPDCPAFDEWQFFQTESLRQELASALERLVRGHSSQGEFELAIPYARRWLGLDPLRESARRQLMQLYAWAGQQAAALRQYEACVRILAKDLGILPSEETTELYQAIKEKRTSPPPAVEPASRGAPLQTQSAEPPHLSAQPPLFFEQEEEPVEVESSVFVARERELTQLGEFLEMALAGQGPVVFVTGEVGQGKTSLLNEFARRAQEAQPELIVTSGNCTAFAGTGDPYLPFRDVMGMLTGDVEARWAAGTITRDYARRLWHLLPITVQALIEDGPDLIDVFVPGSALVGRATTAVPDGTAWLERLKALMARQQTGPIGLEQSYLFEQYASVLQRLAAQHPLLITLDDLQWADVASISLLFHLGRRISGSQILIVGAYRPDEVALGWDGERHPLEKVLTEFKRTFGDIWLDLAQAAEGAEGRRFVDALLDTQPNHLGEGFRQALFRQTGGHPLFTIELLRAMQARGDLVKNKERHWVEGSALDWRTLPARVEGVIEERIGRLEAELREILAVASVEGENFTVEVVARVQGLSQRQLLQQLSQELEQRHRLVREQEEVKAGQQLLSRCKFSHILFQRYLYDSLSAGERRFLHGEIAQALEALYEGHTDEIAILLAHHFLEAGEREKAIEYARQAARRAQAVYAYDEAIQHLQTALDLLETGEQVETQLALLEELADVHGLLMKDTQAISLYQAALDRWSGLADADGMIAVRLHRKILELAFAIKWRVEFEEFEALSETLAASRAYLEASLPLAESEPPQLELVHVLTTLANDTLADDTGIRLPSALDTAARYAQSAVDLAEQLDAPVELSTALQALAGVYFARGLLPKQLEVSRRRLALSRDPRFSDVRKQINILESLSDALILGGEYAQAISYLLEAESLAAQIRAVEPQVLSLNNQALCWFRLDRWDELFKVDEKRRNLEQRYPPEQIGPICLEISLSAAARALRGDFDQARALREQAYAIMVQLAGESPENWERVMYY